SDGSTPNGLIQGKGGDLYGTTLDGGANGRGFGGCGTIFKMTTSGALTTLHNFDFDCFWPYAGLVRGTDGALYGTTAFGGGGGFAGDGYGTVFKILQDGSGFTTLYDFTGGADGVNPWAALIQDGALYGTNYGWAVDDQG